MSIVLPSHPSCRELVELVTDYLDGALGERDRCRFEEHLVSCEACVAYVDQVRRTIRMAGTLSEEAITPEAERALMDAFRGFRREGA